jgi:hypothetical protein
VCFTPRNKARTSNAWTHALAKRHPSIVLISLAKTKEVRRRTLSATRIIPYRYWLHFCQPYPHTQNRTVPFRFRSTRYPHSNCNKSFVVHRFQLRSSGRSVCRINHASRKGFLVQARDVRNFVKSLSRCCFRGSCYP